MIYIHSWLLDGSWFFSQDTITKILLILVTAILGLWNEFRTKIFKEDEKKKDRRNRYYIVVLIIILALTLFAELSKTKSAHDTNVSLAQKANEAEARLQVMDSIVHNSLDSLKSVVRSTDSIKKVNHQLAITTAKQVELSKSISGSITKIQDVQTEVNATQKSILANTERSLEPLSVSGLAITLVYDMKHPFMARIMQQIDSMKALQQKYFLAGKATADGWEYKNVPGFLAGFDENNKLIGSIQLMDEAIRSFHFYSPSIEFRVYNKKPTETKTKDGPNINTYTVTYDPSRPDLEFIAYSRQDSFIVESVTADYETKKIIFTIHPSNWHFTIDNGSVLSFKDLFGKYFQISAFYSYWKENEEKIDIESVSLTNDKKKLQFKLNKKEKSDFANTFNVSYFHFVKSSDQIK